ncbi:LW008 [Lumpy skin disease virus]|nr:LW008 [Lumpy skin disease virus]
MGAAVFFAFLLFKLCSSFPKDIKLTSNDFNSNIGWINDDNSSNYKVMIMTYSSGEWKQACNYTIQKYCNVSPFIDDNTDDFWIKFITVDNTESNVFTFKPICESVVITTPSVFIKRQDVNTVLTINHPLAKDNNKNSPIYNNDKYCNIVFKYILSITFGDSNTIKYEVDEQFCDKKGCAIEFGSQEKVCVTVFGNYETDYYQIRTNETSKACIDELTPRKVDTFLVKQKTDLSLLKRRIQKVTKNKFKGEKSFNKIVGIYNLVLSLFEYIVNELN